MAGSRLLDLGLVHSPQLHASRRVQVWVPPPGLVRGPLPAVYFHDGQNLFRREDSFLGATWGVPKTFDQLAREGQPALAVGIWNGGRRRLAELSPPHALAGAGLLERHLDFLAETVVPAIDERFATRREAGSRALVGSSLGGLATVWGFLTRPATFGLAAALSPSLALGGGALGALAASNPPRPEARLYLDVGTREIARRRRRAWGRRSPSQRFADLVFGLGARLSHSGWRRGHQWVAVRDVGGRHTESDWARRLPIALRYLLAGIVPATSIRKVPRPLSRRRVA